MKPTTEVVKIKKVCDRKKLQKPDYEEERFKMKTAIVYYSALHGNTKKLLDAIAESNEDDETSRINNI